MTTLDDLQAEIAALKQRLDAQDPPADTARDAADKDGFARILSDHGIDAAQIDDLWARFSEELAHLPERKPMVATLSAFALGFVIGRMSK